MEHPEKDNLPVDVSELGELQSATQECPGVYHLALKREEVALEKPWPEPPYLDRWVRLEGPLVATRIGLYVRIAVMSGRQIRLHRQSLNL